MAGFKLMKKTWGHRNETIFEVIFLESIGDGISSCPWSVLLLVANSLSWALMAFSLVTNVTVFFCLVNVHS